MKYQGYVALTFEQLKKILQIEERYEIGGIDIDFDCDIIKIKLIGDGLPEFLGALPRVKLSEVSKLWGRF